MDIACKIEIFSDIGETWTIQNRGHSDTDNVR